MGMALNITGLRVQAKAGRKMLDIPSLHIPAGQCVAITGPSGAGKTTLLDICAGLIPPSAGQVTWGDRSIATMTERERTAFRRQHIGLVFQDHKLFAELDALSNGALAAAFAPRAERDGLRRTAARLLDRFGLSPRARTPSAVLSGGERQRVALVRALATAPAVLLADEPTAALDRKAADRVATHLFNDARQAGRTVLVVTHDPAVQALADRVIHLSNGMIEPC